MSRIYWHGEHRKSELLGSERAYMGLLCRDLTAGLVADRSIGAEVHPFTRLLPRSESLGNWRDPAMGVRMYLSGWSDKKIVFDGREHDAFEVLLNTVIAMGSEPLALLARIHGLCEAHLWVGEEDRDWLAGVIEQGRERNIMRPGAGWESVVEHLRCGDGGPVVMSYSVTDSFPNMPRSWIDEGWPPEQRGLYQYDRLTDEQKQTLEDRQESWYDMPNEERWRIAFDAIRDHWWLRLTPQNLLQPAFGTLATLWDAMQSPEWLGRTASEART